MSTHLVASAVFPQRLEKVWAIIRNFDFPAKLFDGVECKMDNGAKPTEVGATRTTKWKGDNHEQTEVHRLLEVSDLHHCIRWELINSSVDTEVSAYLSKLSLVRITEDDSTLVSWSADFSADVKSSFLKFHNKSFNENLKEMRKNL